jgi:hypothetical protein
MRLFIAGGKLGKDPGHGPGACQSVEDRAHAAENEPLVMKLQGGGFFKSTKTAFFGVELILFLWSEFGIS